MPLSIVGVETPILREISPAMARRGQLSAERAVPGCIEEVKNSRINLGPLATAALTASITGGPLLSASPPHGQPNLRAQPGKASSKTVSVGSWAPELTPISIRTSLDIEIRVVPSSAPVTPEVTLGKSN